MTGLYSAWLQVGSLPALTGTPYGQTLILKLILIVPLLLLGGFNLLVVTRKLRTAETMERVEGWTRNFVSALAAEAVIVTLLLGVVGMLVESAPARQVMERQIGSLQVPLEDGGQTGTLIVSPGTAGQNRYWLELSGGHESHLLNPSTTAASIRFELPQGETDPREVQLAPSAAGGYEAEGSELAVPGDWRIEVTVREPGEPDWSVQTSMAIDAEASLAQAAPPPPPPLFGRGGIAALALLVLGNASIIFALFAAGSGHRKEAAALGAAAIAFGLVLLVQARLPADAGAASGADAAELTPPGSECVAGCGEEVEEGALFAWDSP